MATHSSILAWRIPRIEEPGGIQSTGSEGVRHDGSDLARTRSARAHESGPTGLAGLTETPFPVSPASNMEGPGFRHSGSPGCRLPALPTGGRQGGFPNALHLFSLPFLELRTSDCLSVLT